MPDETNDFAVTAGITVWEDDPASGTLTTVPLPDITKPPFVYEFDVAEPPRSDQTGTAEFRYWNAAEALRRSVDFWEPKLGNRWQCGDILGVNLDRWEELDADYNRTSLNFYHRTLPDQTVVYTGASPDTLSHELGHAILDTMKPDLWDRGVPEIAAFHESFGDMNAILSALQLPSLRTSILAETQGRLYCNSRLTRLAEQFGITLHGEDAHLADANCLRNAWNGFNYCDPFSLDPEELTASLSSNPHSFSRIFTGALFEALCTFLDYHAADSSAPTPDELLHVSVQMRDFIAAGVSRSTAVTYYFAEVARRMVEESAPINAQCSAILLDIFVRRLILSGETAAAIRSRQTASGIAAVNPEEPFPLSELVAVSIPALQAGLGEPLLVDAGARTSSFIARSAGPDGRSLEPASPEAAAAAFVSELFANDQIDPSVYSSRDTILPDKQDSRTHMIVREENGLRLRRRLFHCGTC
ncbi:hypothetical protein LJR235_004181 [Pararhizobium sp. LjRoot235]|uniref:hypothetical protein n=1 Tax=Pararhizobium sp. LjRoot235 TaxID=3342291 RepID=UPI003ED0D5CC